MDRQPGETSLRTERDDLIARMNTVRAAIIGAVGGLMIALAVTGVAIAVGNWGFAVAALATGAVTALALLVGVRHYRRARSLLAVIESLPAHGPVTPP